MDLTTKIGSLTLRNPVIAASGCFGYGLEYRHVVDLASLGGVCVKGLFMAEREGHPPQRIVETPSGMLNAIGLQGVGVHRFVKEHLPGLREAGATVFVNICGTTLDEYVEVAKVLSDAEGVAAIELNISCPNIKEGGIQFGCSLDGTYGVVSAVRQATHLPLIPKLTPNVTTPASFARAAGATVLVNICGTTLDEYVEVAKILSDAEGVGAIELNISCPNIKEGGIQFGCSLDGTYGVVSAVRQATALPLIPKLTPNVTSPATFARAAEDAGADAISLVNTFLAMAIDVETRKPVLSNGMGGLSGPAIRPIAVRMVYECRQAVSIPIIGMGGIMDARDVLEFMLAGATAVQVGTANLVDPFVWGKILKGLAEYGERHRIARLSDLVGAAHLTHTPEPA